MRADTRIESDAFDDLLAVQPQALRIGIQLVEIGHPHCQIGIGKQLDRFGFGGIGEQHRDIQLDRPFQQQLGKGFGALGTFTNDNARRIEIIVQRAAFA